MKNMVDSGGGEFVNAEKAEEISKKLVEISDQIDERSAAVLGSRDKKKKQSGMWWLLLLLLPAGAFAFIWFKKRYINDAQAWRILVGLD